MATTEFLTGIRERLSYVEETTFSVGGSMANDGVVVGYDAYMESPDWDKGYQELLSAGADNRTVENLNVGAKSYPFTLSWTLTDFRFMKYLMDVVHSGSGPFTHTFSVGNTLKSFALEWVRYHTTNVVYSLIGCVILNARLTWQKATGEGSEGHIRVVAQCVARSGTKGSSVTTLAQGNASGVPYLFRMAQFTFNGSQYSEMNNGELTFDNGINLSDSRYCSTVYNGEIADPIAGTFRMSGRVNVNVKDDTFYQRWEGATPVADTRINFERVASTDVMEYAFGGFFLKRAIAGTNQEGGVTSVDLIFQEVKNFSTPVGTDSTTPF